MFFVLRIIMRAVNAIGESNRRRAEREVARVIHNSGGKFTDSLERGIERTYR